MANISLHRAGKVKVKACVVTGNYFIGLSVESGNIVDTINIFFASREEWAQAVDMFKTSSIVIDDDTIPDKEAAND